MSARKLSAACGVVGGCLFFTFTDLAVTMLSTVHGCQSGAWSAGQENATGNLTRVQVNNNAQ